MLRLFVISIIVFAASPNLASASASDQDPRLAQICYDAINRASRSMGVPQQVMLAISLTETGRRMDGQMRPWPWTVNMEGKGIWFDTQREALSYVHKEFARGARSFDVGCFQINYKWHHQHFASIEAMFDPTINAMYAAKFLRELYLEKGSWKAAAGAYHSRTPKYANKYADRFERYLARLAGQNVPAFSGHGSEPLQIAATRSSRPVRGTSQYGPVLDIGRTTPLLSPGPTLRGSLATGGTGPGLLQSARGSLF